MTVSWRRSAEPTGEGCGAAVSVVGVATASTAVAGSLWPHSKQNLALAGFVLPHDGQRPRRAAPHSRQNLLPSGMSALQLGQRTDHPPGLRAFYFTTVSELRCGIWRTALECRPKR